MATDLTEYPLEDPSVVDVADAVSIAAATERLITVCMAGAGFSYLPTRVVDDYPVYRPFGLVDLESARALGYQQPPEIAERMARSEALRSTFDQTMNERTAEDRSAYLKALWGDLTQAERVTSDLGQTPVARDGCTAKALDELTSGRGFAFRVLEIKLGDLKGKAVEAARKDPEYVAANAAWASCMQTRGLDEFDDFLSIGATYARATRDRALSQREVAIADVECKRRVALVQTVAAVTLRHQQEIASANQGVVEEFHALYDVLLESAKR